MKGIKHTAEEAHRLTEISRNILESIVAIASTEAAAIGDLLQFTKITKKDFDVSIDMMIGDREDAIGSEPHAAEDLQTLKHIKEAISDGILVEASILIMKIKDDFLQDTLFYDFKELNAYTYKSETMIDKLPTLHKKELVKSIGYLNENGLVEIKNIENHELNSFMEVFAQTKSSSEPHDSKVEQEACLSFDDEPTEVMSPK